MSIHPEIKSEARRLHAEGRGRNAIARELGISTRQVDNLAREMGLRFDTARTRAAARARRSAAAQDRDELAAGARRLAHDVLARAVAADDVLELRRLVMVVLDLVNIDIRLEEAVPPVTDRENNPDQVHDEELAELSRMIGMKRRAVARS